MAYTNFDGSLLQFYSKKDDEHETNEYFRDKNLPTSDAESVKAY